MKKFWQWLVYSSEDPSRYSLTIKSALGVVVTGVTMLSGLAQLQLGDLTPVVDGVVVLVQSVLMAVSAFAFLVGLVRKLWNTYLAWKNETGV